jgi:hypothetical protein
MTTEVTSLAAGTAPPRVKARSRPLYGLANLGVVVGLALGSWYLLADPTLSPWKLYPLPFNAALFWAILFMAAMSPQWLLEALGAVADPRKRRGVRHRFISILALCACAVLAGARSFIASPSGPGPEHAAAACEVGHWPGPVV